MPFYTNPPTHARTHTCAAQCACTRTNTPVHAHAPPCHPPVHLRTHAPTHPHTYMHTAHTAQTHTHTRARAPAREPATHPCTHPGTLALAYAHLIVWQFIRVRHVCRPVGVAANTNEMIALGLELFELVNLGLVPGPRSRVGCHQPGTAALQGPSFCVDLALRGAPSGFQQVIPQAGPSAVLRAACCAPDSQSPKQALRPASPALYAPLAPPVPPEPPAPAALPELAVPPPPPPL